MNIDLETVRNYFSKDHFAVNAGTVIDAAAEDCVQCSMEITPNHLNIGGGVQGGAIFTLAELAFAVHCNLPLACGEDTGLTVGQSCNITFLRGAKGKRLIAKSICLLKGGSISVYRISVEDDLGIIIAEMYGNAYATGRKISG
ncbi:MAG: PaaI family thioesterase [Syntrophomonadaceae bacterium]|jgi:acyl-CoA thioesterase|nr:PaaI family thioesterase [Syntrophomonadaceae bacterium]